MYIVIGGYLHLIDICFLWCICLWQISLIQTCLGVFVRPGFVSTSPAFMRSRASHPTVHMTGLPKKTVKRAPIAGDECFDIISSLRCRSWPLVTFAWNKASCTDHMKPFLVLRRGWAGI